MERWIDIVDGKMDGWKIKIRCYESVECDSNEVPNLFGQMWQIRLEASISVSRHINISFGQCHFFLCRHYSRRSCQATKCFHTCDSDITVFQLEKLLTIRTAQRNKANWICNQAVWIMRLNDSQMKDWKWFDIWFGLYISTTGQTPVRLIPAWFQKETHGHTGEEPTRKEENPPVFSCRRGCRAPLGFWRILILHLTEHQRDALSVFIRGSQQHWDMPISLCLSLGLSVFPSSTMPGNLLITPLALALVLVQEKS